jgi:hypothetical protein
VLISLTSATSPNWPFLAAFFRREWIETTQSLGRPIPEPRGRMIYA